jgi:uncharacterized protein YbcV (DUF1398 family)
MFTINDIQTAEQEIKTGADFPKFARTLKALGVKRNDVYVMNGMAIYFGEGNETVEGPPLYEHLLIEEHSSVNDLQKALSIHQRGETDYQTFCRQAAAAGVEKWIVDLVDMTVTYLGDAGTVLLVEKIHN